MTPRLNLMSKHGRRSSSVFDEPEFKYALSVLAICFILLWYNLGFLRMTVADEGPVTVTGIINSSPSGYYQDPTWTLTFFEKKGVHQVICKLSTVEIGGVYHLYRLRNGKYSLRELR